MLARRFPLFVILCLAGSLAGASPASVPAVAAGLPAGSTATAGSAGPATTGRPAEFFGDWLTPYGLAAFSAATGRAERRLVPPAAGGGVGQLALAPGGKAISFADGGGSCASSIDSVAASGGQVTVLVPYQARDGGIPAFGPAYSSDGRYFSYGTLQCDNGATFLHIRDLGTGKTDVYRTNDGLQGLTFVNDDRRGVFLADGKLAAVALPALTTRTYSPPAGCTYKQVAGTETTLVAALECGKRDRLSLVSLSVHTLQVTGTIASLGTCQLADSLSQAPSAPANLLLEVTLGCDNGPTSDPRAVLLEIHGSTVRQVRSGKFSALPANLVW
jgi:hypothetical protein